VTLQSTLENLRKTLNRQITDKDYPHNYINIYQQEMSLVDNVSILEIGVAGGGSLILWDSYFKNSNVVGIDLYPDFNGTIPDGIDYPVYVIDSTDPDDGDWIFNDEMFDYIVDDGSHNVNDQIKTFNNYYPKLKVGGKYFIEDIEVFENIKIMEEHLSKYNYQVYDLRHINGRSDDVLFVINK
jgi:hypothetical protein